MAVYIANKETMKKNKMLPYKELVEKLRKDYSSKRIYQIDNFSISLSSADSSANHGSTNIHVFDAYKQILSYVKNNDFYKDETKGFEMIIEFRIGSIICSITIVSKKFNGKTKNKIVNFRVGLMTIPLDLEKEIIVKEQKVKIFKLNKIRNIKRFKRFFYYFIYRLYNIINKIKED
jgi:hypothetical protein